MSDFMTIDRFTLIQGQLPNHLHGYPIIYLDTKDRVLCAECATEKINEPDINFRTKGGAPFWEGATISCDECGEDIESAYGDPEEGEEEDDE